MNEQDYADEREAAFPLDLIHLIVGPAIFLISFYPSARVFYFRRFASAASRSEATITRTLACIHILYKVRKETLNTTVTRGSLQAFLFGGCHIMGLYWIPEQRRIFLSRVMALSRPGSVSTVFAASPCASAVSTLRPTDSWPDRYISIILIERLAHSE